MKSYKYLTELKKIPISEDYKGKSTNELLELIDKKKSVDCFIEAGFVAESITVDLFEKRNIPDNLFEAYKDSFSNIATKESLYEHYQAVLEKGDNSVLGFLNNIKGKVFELELRDKLNTLYDGYDFNLAESPIQPVWDLKGINNIGEEILVQAKLWNPNRASDLIDLMNDNPNVLYATTDQLRDIIIESNPELIDQLIDTGVDGFQFTDDVQHNLNLLVENNGIDVPDGLGDILPYISELVLGFRLLLDLINVQRDFSRMSAEDKAKLSAVKVLVLLSRYGVTAICSSMGGALGGLLGGIGTPFGAIAGTFVAGKLNKEIKPYIFEISLELVGLDKEDIFYYQNKEMIDDLALSYKNLKVE